MTNSFDHQSQPPISQADALPEPPLGIQHPLGMKFLQPAFLTPLGTSALGTFKSSFLFDRAEVHQPEVTLPTSTVIQPQHETPEFLDQTLTHTVKSNSGIEHHSAIVKPDSDFSSAASSASSEVSSSISSKPIQTSKEEHLISESGHPSSATNPLHRSGVSADVVEADSAIAFPETHISAQTTQENYQSHLNLEKNNHTQPGIPSELSNSIQDKNEFDIESQLINNTETHNNAQLETASSTAFTGSVSDHPLVSTAAIPTSTIQSKEFSAENSVVDLRGDATIAQEASPQYAELSPEASLLKIGRANLDHPFVAVNSPSPLDDTSSQAVPISETLPAESNVIDSNHSPFVTPPDGLETPIPNTHSTFESPPSSSLPDISPGVPSTASAPIQTAIDQPAISPAQSAQAVADQSIPTQPFPEVAITSTEEHQPQQGQDDHSQLAPNDFVEIEGVPSHKSIEETTAQPTQLALGTSAFQPAAQPPSHSIDLAIPAHDSLPESFSLQSADPGAVSQSTDATLSHTTASTIENADSPALASGYSASPNTPIEANTVQHVPESQRSPVSEEPVQGGFDSQQPILQTAIDPVDRSHTDQSAEIQQQSSFPNTFSLLGSSHTDQSTEIQQQQDVQPDQVAEIQQQSDVQPAISHAQQHVDQTTDTAPNIQPVIAPIQQHVDQTTEVQQQPITQSAIAPVQLEQFDQATDPVPQASIQPVITPTQLEQVDRVTEVQPQPITQPEIAPVDSSQIGESTGLPQVTATVQKSPDIPEASQPNLALEPQNSSSEVDPAHSSAAASDAFHPAVETQPKGVISAIQTAPITESLSENTVPAIQAAAITPYSATTPYPVETTQDHPSHAPSLPTDQSSQTTDPVSAFSDDQSLANLIELTSSPLQAKSEHANAAAEIDSSSPEQLTSKAQINLASPQQAPTLQPDTTRDRAALSFESPPSSDSTPAQLSPEGSQTPILELPPAVIEPTVAQLLAAGSLPTVSMMTTPLGHQRPLIHQAKPLIDLPYDDSSSASELTHEITAPTIQRQPEPDIEPQTFALASPFLAPEIPPTSGHTPESWSSIEDLLNASSPSLPNDLSPQSPRPGSNSESTALNQPAFTQPTVVQPRFEQTHNTHTNEPIRVQAAPVEPIQFVIDSEMRNATAEDSFMGTDTMPVMVRGVPVPEAMQGVPGATQYGNSQLSSSVQQAIAEVLPKTDEPRTTVNLEPLAREIYGLIRQRLEVERERRNALPYSGRLPW